ncbi:MAG: hypothetical protein LBD47_12980 [Treponema sp.]|jgi:hypothetical protein|nr:hypothetical protein [Treponema sp.]
MMVFDISKKWLILAPASVPAARGAADELASYIGLLRSRAGLAGEPPQIEDAETVSPPDAVPVILLNAAGGSPDRNGFAWRIGRDRIEIQGDSGRGLWNAVFDFLAVLGIRWPEPGWEEFPPPAPSSSPGAYPLKNDRDYCPSASSVKERRRLFVGEKLKAKKRELLIQWAARNKYDALVFPLAEKNLWNKAQRGKGIYAETGRYALILEAGGRDLSCLLPRSLFFFHRDMFRMDSGGRVRESHFCLSNPKTIARIKMTAEKLFVRAMMGMDAQTVFRPGAAGENAATPVFHLWPDQGHEKIWCACPACRAFSPAEQNRIAINSVTDVLADLDPRAWLSYLEYPVEAPAAGGVVLHDNTFCVST